MGLANPYQCFKLSPEFHFTLSDPQPVYLGEFRPEPESISVSNYMDRDVAYFRSHATGGREVVFTLPPMQGEMIDAGCKNRMLKARAAYADTAWKLGRSLSLPHKDIYTMKWKRRERSADHTLSSEEIDKLHSDIDACASELSRDVLDLPPEIVRAVQVIKCMDSRGWYVAVDVGCRLS